MMTRDEILALADLLARTSPGPWSCDESEDPRYAGGFAHVYHAKGTIIANVNEDSTFLATAVGFPGSPRTFPNSQLMSQAPAMAETLIAMQTELDAERAAREKLEAEILAAALKVPQIAALVEAAKTVRDPLSANSVGPWPEGYWQLASALAALEPKP